MHVRACNVPGHTLGQEDVRHVAQHMHIARFRTARIQGTWGTSSGIQK